MPRPLTELHTTWQLSSYRESVLEQVFCAELLQAAWICGYDPVEISRPFVDFQGYDLELTAGRLARHVQLKATKGRIVIHEALASKPAACLINLRPAAVEDRTVLTYDFFGSPPGTPLDLTGLKQAKKSTNSLQPDGSWSKNERQHHRVVPITKCERNLNIAQLLALLFGTPE